jgi:pimeloyl-ACP methyl ester carboxylesterase
METPIRVEFRSGDLALVGEQFRADAGRGHVFLLHGGGQTRHAWRTLAQRLAAMGWCATTLDARGHGDSSWDPAGNYTLEAMAIDFEECLADQKPPVVIGASMGGLVALIAIGERKVPARALVLIDVTPAVGAKGAARVRSFMSAHLGGFDSLADVQKTISAYMPRSGARPATGTSRGLLNVVRQREDGRWYWHWDPAMVTGRDATEPFRETERMYRAARSVTVPTLLIRGKLSDVVSPEGAQEFLKVVPNARLVDVSDASHMLAGDNNDLFEDAVIDFLDMLPAVNDDAS